MADLFVLFKSDTDANQVVGQVKGAGKAHHAISRMAADEGIVFKDAHKDADGITLIGEDAETGEDVGYSTVRKSVLAGL